VQQQGRAQGRQGYVVFACNADGRQCLGVINDLW
jgi:hypothetical protein